MEGIGERIKELRILRGLSQDAVAGQLGVSPQAVSKWENGKSCPDLSMIVPLSKLLRVSADELLGSEPRGGSRYEEWDRLLPEDEPEQAAVTALQALSQFPGDAHFLYRLAQAEHMAAARAANPEDRTRFLSAAERHYQATLLQFPDFEAAASGLARVLNSLGRREAAAAVARRVRTGALSSDELLLEILQGDAWEEQRRQVISRRAMALYQALMLRQTEETLSLAERLLEEFPWEEGERLQLLAEICLRRAVLRCEAGQEEAAAAALRRLKALAEKKKALDEARGEGGTPVVYDENMERVPRAPGWLYAVANLKAEGRLKPLAGRPEYRELLRMSERMIGKEGA